MSALAAKRDNVGPLDFVLITREDFDRLNIKTDEIDGDTPDVEVNEKYHIDLKEISAYKLYKLARLCRNGHRDRRTESKVKGLINFEAKLFHLFWHRRDSHALT